MAKGINKVILIGICGQDPEVRYSQAGAAFANLSVATNEKWKDKQTGEQKEHTEWHKLVFSGRLAEVVGEYVKKGSRIYIEGKLATRKWQDQSGQDKYTTEIKCFEMQMLDSVGTRQGGNQQPAPQQAQGNYQQPAQQPAPQSYQQPAQQPQSYQQPQQAQQQRPPQQAQRPAPQQAPSMDQFDDIPFN